jgi:hypothetical protein
MTKKILSTKEEQNLEVMIQCNLEGGAILIYPIDFSSGKSIENKKRIDFFFKMIRIEGRTSGCFRLSLSGESFYSV